MGRTLVITGPSPRSNATIHLPKVFLDNITDYSRCDVLTAMQVAISGYTNQPAHYKEIMETIDFKKRQVLQSLKKLTDCGIIYKAAPGKYCMEPVAAKHTYPAKYWELVVLRGCVLQQIRTWAYVKGHEGIECNRVQLAEHIGLRYPSICRALNTKFDGPRSGVGLIDLNLVYQVDGAWHTPTSGVSPSAPEQDHNDKNPPPPTRARDTSSTSILTSTPNFHFQSRRKPKIITRLTSYALRFAPRRRGAKPDPEGTQAPEGKNLALRKMTIAEVTKKYGEDYIQYCLRTHNINVKSLLASYPWTARIAPRVEQLLRPVAHLDSLVVLQAIKNALEYANYYLPKYDKPFRYLRKWLSRYDNLKKAADDTLYELPWWLIPTDGNSWTTAPGIGST